MRINHGQIYYVASYPKSGATWFRFLMYTCTHGSLEKSALVNVFNTTARTHDDVIIRRLDAGERFFVKSHFPYHSGLPFKEHIRACIYIVRHPLNVMLSKLDHYLLEGVPWIEEEDPRNQEMQNFIQYANHVGMDAEAPLQFAGGWNNHVVSWLRENNDVPVFSIKYEDLCDDAVGVISKLNDDLGLGFTLDMIKKGCELSSFENMKKLEQYEIEHEIRGAFYSPTRKKSHREKNASFVNKGMTRNYGQILNAEFIECAKNVLAEGMRLAGYVS